MPPKPLPLAALAALLAAGMALAHPGPDPQPGFLRQLEDCVDDYGNEAGQPLTQKGHNLVNLDVGEVERDGERRFSLYLVMGRLHRLVNFTEVRDTLSFATPAGPVSVTVARTGGDAFQVVGGLVPERFAAPLPTDEDPRYAMELGFGYAQLGLRNGDLVRNFTVLGEFREVTGLWSGGDILAGGFYDPLLGGLTGPVSLCDPDDDPVAFIGPPYQVRHAPG